MSTHIIPLVTTSLYQITEICEKIQNLYFTGNKIKGAGPAILIKGAGPREKRIT